MISSFVHRTSHYQATRNISVTHLRIIITITSDCGLNQVVKSYCTIMADKDLKTNKKCVDEMNKSEICSQTVLFTCQFSWVLFVMNDKKLYSFSLEYKICGNKVQFYF